MQRRICILVAKVGKTIWTWMNNTQNEDMEEKQE